MAGKGDLIGAIIGWVGYHLGQRTDAASATGSAHGKLKDIKDYLSGTIVSTINTRQKPRKLYSTVISTNETTYQNLFNVSGPGRIIAIIFEGDNATGESAGVEVTLDGVLITRCKMNGIFTVSPSRNMSELATFCYAVADDTVTGSSAAERAFHGFSALDWPFLITANIKLRKTGTNSVDLHILYELEQ